ncbi:MAG: branched-chain amino acid ABC transporter permease, partial [Ilumatobacteraceae bacterium]
MIASGRRPHADLGPTTAAPRGGRRRARPPAIGLLVAIPSLRLRGDYLASVTFGFGEIIRLGASTRLFSAYTNGALGFPGIDGSYGKSLWWTFGALAVTVFVMAKLKYSSYGRAMQAIREDEIAARAMGVAVARHKILGFVISAFFAGIAGGLWISWLGGVRLD